MASFQTTRRQLIQVLGGTSLLTLLGRNQRTQTMLTLYTFGDSILDCGRYNKFSIHLRQPNPACGVSQKYGVLFFPMS